MGSMGLVKPVNHGSADIWDTILSTLFDLVEEHDHTTGKGVKVPAAALRINADVPWSDAGTPYAITGAKAIDFAAVAAATVTSLAGALFVNSADNELYYRTIAGTNVKFTDGAALNVAAFTGGIGGDYSSIAALVDYDDATDTYRFRQQVNSGVRQFAKVEFADIKLIEYDISGDPTVPTNFVTIKSPDALAASYDITWLTGLPATTVPLQVSSAGQLSATNTITLTGTVTASDFRHTTAQSQLIHGAASETEGLNTRLTGARGWNIIASTAPIKWPITLPAGCVITGYTMYLTKNSNATETYFARVGHTQGGSGTDITDSAGSNNAANNPGSITLSESGLSITTATTNAYYVEFVSSGGFAAGNTRHVEVTYTRP